MTVGSTLSDTPGEGGDDAPRKKRNLRWHQRYSWYLKPILWRLFNPRGKPEDYYAEEIAGRIRRGIRHPAIGSKSRPLRAPTELLDILLTHGLTPEQVVVDYGCGSFRLGKALIEYLEPGRYWGLDVHTDFLDAGMDLLEPELKAEKRPNARMIDAANLAETAAAKPDFVVSWHVCSKVPPNRLNDYFGKMIGLLAPASVALVHFPETAKRERRSRFSWSVSRETIAQAIHSVDPTLKLRFAPVTDRVAQGVRHTMVEIRRS